MSGGHLGERLKYVRNNVLRVGPTELSRMLAKVEPPVPGSDHGSVGSYERGRAPSPEYLAAVVRISGVDGHWLLTGEGGPERAPKATKEAAFDAIARYVDRVRASGAGEDPPDDLEPPGDPGASKPA